MYQEPLELLQSKRRTSSTSNDLFDSNAFGLAEVGSSELIHPRRTAAEGKLEGERGKKVGWLDEGKRKKREGRKLEEEEEEREESWLAAFRGDEPGTRPQTWGELDHGVMKASSGSSLMRRRGSAIQQRWFDDDSLAEASAELERGTSRFTAPVMPRVRPQVKRESCSGAVGDAGCCRRGGRGRGGSRRAEVEGVQRRNCPSVYEAWTKSCRTSIKPVEYSRAAFPASRRLLSGCTGLEIIAETSSPRFSHLANAPGITERTYYTPSINQASAVFIFTPP